MEIYVDDARAGITLDPDESLEHELRVVQASVPPDRFIVSVKCDGLHLTNEELREALERPTGAFRCIEVGTSTAPELARGALIEARTALDDVDTKRKDIAERFAAGRASDAMRGLGEMLAVWQQLHEVVTKSLRMLSLDPAEVEVEGGTLESALEAPMQLLVSIRDALKAQDLVQLADILEYEFGEAVESWGMIVDTLVLAAQTSGEGHEDPV